MTWRPVLLLLLISPWLGEVLSTATSPLALLEPWKLILSCALYGGGALLCREIVQRRRSGLRGLILLGAAYGIYEEALVDRFWFDPAYAQAAGVGSYSVVWHTNLLLAAHLTLFHAAVSIGASVVIAERLFPGGKPWLPGAALPVVALGMLLVLLLTDDGYVRPPLFPALAALALAAALCAAALVSSRSDERHRTRAGRPRLLGLVAFVCTGAHFVLVYAIPSTGLPWPVGLALALSPVAVGVILARRWSGTGAPNRAGAPNAAGVRGRGGVGAYGKGGLWILTGVLGFFLMLDALVGLGGRYDLTTGAVAAAFGLVWLHRRERQVAAGPLNGTAAGKAG